MSLLKRTFFFLLATLFALAQASCDAPSPAFPLPNLDNHSPALRTTTDQIISALKPIISKSEYDTTSFSVEVTSQSRSLSSFQHTARERSDLFGGGAKIVGNDTRYRIASMTKPFTVLAMLQLQKAGHVNLDDPVLKYLPDLGEGQTGSLPWKDITLRALMSQQAGIPRDFAQDDLLNNPAERVGLGLPEVDRETLDLPTCDEFANYTRPCNVTDFLQYIKTLTPLFAPNQHSSYSNINYDLLGIVIAKVANTSYDDYITDNILQPLGMNQSTFRQPPDSVAAIAKGIEYYWPFYMRIQNPTGGMYSSSNDMSIWLRYVLSTYNGQTPALNWLAPTSYSGSIQSFYGVPWEIYRAKVKDVVPDGLGLNSTRPLSFVTKGGGLPAYSSIVIIMPEYGLGITILVAGNGKALAEIREVVTRHMVGFAEQAALTELQTKYVGTFENKHTKTKLVFARSAEQGLFLEQWYSNGTDTLAALKANFLREGRGELLLHVIPTLLYVDEKKQAGERWRVVPAVDKVVKSVWDNFCVGDWDFLQYAGKPVNEVVFWIDDGGRVGEVGLTGFRSVLRPVKGGSGDGAEDALEQDRLVEQTGRCYLCQYWYWTVHHTH